MRILLIAPLATLLATSTAAQVSNPAASASVDTSNLATKQDVQSAQSLAQSALTASTGAVKSVNTNLPDSSGNAAIDLTPYATTSALGAAIAADQAQTVQFVNGGAIQTVAQLQAGQPCSLTYLTKYARVSDLWGSVTSSMICETNGGSYYWRPTRTDYAVNNASTGGAITLTPLLSAPVQILTGSLASTMTITPSSTNVWPGAQFVVTAKGALGLFGININGLIGGGTLSILAGSTRTLTYTSTGWQGN